MVPENPTRWTAARIQATVTPDFILKQFRPDKQRQLKQSISYGDGLTDSTYVGWILERANRLFLILVDIGAADHIFSFVNRSYDDSHLPMAAQRLKELRLSGGRDTLLEKKFYLAQFNFLVRDVEEGAHIRFLDDERVPVTPVGASGIGKSAGATSGIGRSGKDVMDKVQLSSGVAEIYSRKRVAIRVPPNYLTEEDILFEVNSAKRLANEHVLSVYGTYSQGSNVFILLRPAIDISLASFLSSPPKSFDHLPKPRRREILLNWPHCLAHGLAWLHSNSRSHGAIRPSNILIDNDHRIYLGQIDGFTMTEANIKVSDIESYHYAAPERWKRAATVQKKAPVVSLYSGGRTAHKPGLGKRGGPGSGQASHDNLGSPPSSASPDFSMDISNPTSTAYAFIPTSKGSRSREYAPSVLSSRSSGTKHRAGSVLGSSSPQPHNRMISMSSAARSIVSSSSSNSGNNVNPHMPKSVTVAPSEVRTTVIQTWQSAQDDPLAADIFSLGAVITDIITFVCKRSIGAFTKHRSSRNRTAGRGGGVADASFHANLGQVFSWTVSLTDEAAKKASHADGNILSAVGPIIDVARECLARAAEDRPEADVVEKSLEWCIQQVRGSARAHCKFEACPVFDPTAETSPDGDGRNYSSMSTREEETGVRPRTSASQMASLHSARSKTTRQQKPEHSTALAQFNFEYGDPARDGRGRFSPADTDTIDLQSIADRADQMDDRAATSGWSHLQPDPRASYLSSYTEADSVAETELEAEFADSLFRPTSQSPRPGANSQGLLPIRTLSPLSRAQADLSDAARKRVEPDAAPSRQGSTTPTAMRRRRAVTNPDPQSRRRDSVSSDEVDSHMDKDMSTKERRRGRLSVSTLASNSSTIRMSWQQRDVSPVSIHAATTGTSPSISMGRSFEDQSETSSMTSQSQSFYRHHEQQRDSAWTFGLGNEERLSDKSRWNAPSPVHRAKENKEKHKAPNPVSRIARFQTRYSSILGGRM